MQTNLLGRRFEVRPKVDCDQEVVVGEIVVFESLPDSCCVGILQDSGEVIGRDLAECTLHELPPKGTWPEEMPEGFWLHKTDEYLTAALKPACVLYQRVTCAWTLTYEGRVLKGLDPCGAYAAKRVAYAHLRDTKPFPYPGVSQ